MEGVLLSISCNCKTLVNQLDKREESGIHQGESKFHYFYIFKRVSIILIIHDDKKQEKHHSGAPARAKRARSRAPWVRKFGKLSFPENLVMTQRTPVRTHISCKPMSNVTIDLAQLDQPLSYVSHPYEYDQIDSCQNRTSADNYHMTVSRAQMIDHLFCPHI